MDFIVISKFDKHVHYSDRNMIWFKWRIDCLQDYNFCKLDSEAKWCYVGLVCLACKTKNATPHDVEWLAGQLSIAAPNIVKSLKSLRDSGMIAVCKQDAMPNRTDKNRTESQRQRMREGL